MRKLKSILSLVLAFCLLMSTVIVAFAAETQAASTVEHLVTIETNNVHYNITNPDPQNPGSLETGTVGGYSPKDGVIYKHYTTLDGVMEKEDPDNWEFVVPEKLKELWKNEDFGMYAREDGKMPVAFLSNNDITGGNSGSPIMNAKGELIGLAFDGNWESMSSDVMFEPALQRCINVDIRYVLFIVEKFGGAKWLIDEMKIVK